MTENRHKQKVPANMNKADQRHNAEVEALRIRLEEAEETLRAIRSNEVDALVVDGPQGQQVFTLQGAEQPYRILMETMSEGALTLSADGTILYCNRQFAEMLQAPLNSIIGTSFYDFVISHNRPSLEAMLLACGTKDYRGEFLFRGVDGGEMPVSLSARPIILNSVDAFCIVAIDLAEQKRTQKALEKARDHLETKVNERTITLKETIARLEELNRVFVNRELRMIELKKRIAELEQRT